jgi:prepilin-type processing-associated H-X9-DG protein
VLYLLNSPLARYGAAPGIWRCPSDQSTRTVNGLRLPRTRSLSMNEQLGTYHPYRTLDHHPPWVTDWMWSLTVKKAADIRNPGPAQCSVFLEAREDAIEDSHFLVAPYGFREASPALYRLVDFPGNYHNGAGNLTFADGHAESHRWRDPRTKPPLVRDHPILRTVEGLSCPGNPDVQWIQQRTFQRGD